MFFPRKAAWALLAALIVALTPLGSPDLRGNLNVPKAEAAHPENFGCNDAAGTNVYVNCWGRLVRPWNDTGGQFGTTASFVFHYPANYPGIASLAVSTPGYACHQDVINGVKRLWCTGKTPVGSFTQFDWVLHVQGNCGETHQVAVVVAQPYGTPTAYDAIKFPDCPRPPTVRFSAVKSAPATVAPGQVISYTIDVRNDGDAATVRLADNVPAGLAYVPEQSTPGCGQQGGTVYCQPVGYAPGQVVRHVLSFRVAANVACGTRIDNVADIQTGPNSFAWSNHHISTVTCPNPNVDLSIRKTGPATVQPGQTFTYTLTTRTDGPGTRYGVRVTDTLPAGLEFVSTNSPQACAMQGNTFVCNIPEADFPAGSEGGITLTVRAAANIACGSTITNSATIQNTLTTDPNAANNTSTATTTVQCPQPTTTTVVAEKTGPGTVQPGQTAVYTLTIRNTGNAAAVNPFIRDHFEIANAVPVQLPQGCTDHNVINNRRIVQCTVPTLAPGAAVSFTLRYQLPQSLQCGSAFNNIAGADADNAPASTLTTVTSTVQCAPQGADLSVTKSGPSTAARGQTVSYTVTAANAGPAQATNVVIADVIPQGLTFNAGASSQGCVLNGAGTSVLCNNFNLNAGESRTFTIVFNVPTVQSCTQTTVQNTATVSASSTDPNSANNTSAAVTTTLTCPQTPPQCSDGIDNDGDGRTDFFDPGCYPNGVFNSISYNPNDNSEGGDTQFGCIEVTKEAFTSGGAPITPVPQFRFTLDGRSPRLNNSTGRFTYQNVVPGTHTVAETVPQGWTQMSVTPAGGTVTVNPGTQCAQVRFQNRQIVP